MHVAMIMDGNGRWAKARGLPRLKGHEAGAQTVRRVIKYCKNSAEIKYLTLYAFSVENWTRPTDEVNGLMSLLGQFLLQEEKSLHENQLRLRIMGRKTDLPSNLQRELTRVEHETEHYDRQLIIALSYGARTEITKAAKEIALAVKNGEINPEEIDDRLFAKHLYLPDLPDPDLIIRTSGEMRLSNFMLWQASYSELYITPVLWPDFSDEDFDNAIETFKKRNRRFGNI